MTALAEELRTYKHLIGGESVAPSNSETILRSNPATGRPVAAVGAGTAADAEIAIAVARREFDHGKWPKLAGRERARILARWATLIGENLEVLARLEVEEVGKPIRQARGEILGVVDVIEHAAALARNIHGSHYDDFGGSVSAVIAREPIGVVGVITPWNFPTYIYASTVPFALAAGCTVVSKPSEFTSGTTLEVSRLAHDAGLPPDALNVITGYGPDVGMPLALSADVNMISFTGSTTTGKLLAQAASPYPKRISLELGGKGSSIVFADADLDQAIEGVLIGVFANQGETCSAGSRLLVEDSIADEFVAQLVRYADSLQVGDPTDERTDLGALIHEQHLQRVLDYVANGIESGASLATGGRRLTTGTLADGCFMSATILDQVPKGTAVFEEEIFGPVLSVARFSSLDEARELANATTYGLGNSIWTKDIDTALTLARGLRSGTVWVNTMHEGPAQLPFGGYKGSGTGRVRGDAGLLDFLETKTIVVRLAPRKFYPYLRP